MLSSAGCPWLPAGTWGEVGSKNRPTFTVVYPRPVQLQTDAQCLESSMLMATMMAYVPNSAGSDKAVH